MAAAAIMNCYLVTLDHQRSLLHGRKSLSCQSHYYFKSYGHLKILQIWLKTPIPAPKIYVLGDFDPQTLFFVIETPKRHILGRIRVFLMYTSLKSVHSFLL